MKQNKTCAIIIPIYQDAPESIIEQCSLQSLLQNSSKFTKTHYSVILIGPKKIQHRIDELSNNISTYFYTSSSLFDDEYFESPITYSQLLKSHSFYELFKDYDYILIYQTDCFMLSDNITEWVEAGYDYVGAPIVSENSGWRIVPVVGNGGCSLRKVDWFLKVTDPNGEVQSRFKDELSKEISARENGYENFEDLYFAELLAYYNGMKRPNYKEAALFAWDMNPDIMIGVTRGKFPGFLHAYDKNLRWYRQNINNHLLRDKELFRETEEKWKELHQFYMKDSKNPSSYL